MDHPVTVQVRIYGSNGRSWSGLAVVDKAAMDSCVEAHLLDGLVGSLIILLILQT